MHPKIMCISKLQRKNKKTARRIRLILSWSAVALLEGLIFYFSHQNAAASSGQSDGLVSWLSALGLLLDADTVRTFAHAFEYFCLSFCLFWAYRFSFLRSRPILTVLTVLLSAVGDEMHQLFVPGRAFQFADILVDTSGGVLALLFCFGILYCKQHLEKREDLYGNRKTF